MSRNYNDDYDDEGKRFFVEYDTVGFEQARDIASERITRRAELEQQATTDAAAALEMVKQIFRRYHAAVKDGTESERVGMRAELAKACDQYNALADRYTRRSA